MAETMSLLDRLAYRQMIVRLERAEWDIEAARKGVQQDGHTAIADALDSVLAELRAALFDIQNIYDTGTPISVLLQTMGAEMAEERITGEFLARMYHEAKAASTGPTADAAVRTAWDFVADVVNHRIDVAANAAWKVALSGGSWK